MQKQFFLISQIKTVTINLSRTLNSVWKIIILVYETYQNILNSDFGPFSSHPDTSFSKKHFSFSPN
jgi:hypothetical protein